MRVFGVVAGLLRFSAVFAAKRAAILNTLELRRKVRCDTFTAHKRFDLLGRRSCWLRRHASFSVTMTLRATMMVAAMPFAIQTVRLMESTHLSKCASLSLIRFISASMSASLICDSGMTCCFKSGIPCSSSTFAPITRFAVALLRL